ncbi:hypothetical protein J4226_05035 [Candidatus Pacearchaeota archaeon]|nr:hypothetical protein [Candidatus Pacearchaeota archaeon]
MTEEILFWFRLLEPTLAVLAVIIIMLVYRRFGGDDIKKEMVFLKSGIFFMIVSMGWKFITEIGIIPLSLITEIIFELFLIAGVVMIFIGSKNFMRQMKGAGRKGKMIMSLAAGLLFFVPMVLAQVGGNILQEASLLNIGLGLIVVIIDIVVVIFAFIVRKYFIGGIDEVFKWILNGVVFYMFGNILQLIMELDRAINLEFFGLLSILFAFICFVISALKVRDISESYGMGVKNEF